MSVSTALADRELRAAAITDPQLRSDYRLARTVNGRHGKTYFLAALLLPAAKRPHVHALYGFARHADDIVDAVDEPSERAQLFTAWSDRVTDDLVHGRSDHPVCRALLHTKHVWDIPTSYFLDFLTAMRSDLTFTGFASYADLCRYMWGSAAVIGLQMLPILGRAHPRAPEDEVRSAAIDLGLAFQLTNVIRDVGEDLDRGRVYLPQDSLDRFGISMEQLQAGRRDGRVDESIRRLLAYEIDRTRGLYRSARRGIPLVHPTSQDCLYTAATLYEEILDRVEQADFNVFGPRLTVSRGRRAAVAARGVIRARAARIGWHR
jgi:phytoene synthase